MWNIRNAIFFQALNIKNKTCERAYKFEHLVRWDLACKKETFKMNQIQLGEVESRWISMGSAFPNSGEHRKIFKTTT